MIEVRPSWKALFVLVAYELHDDETIVFLPMVNKV